MNIELAAFKIIQLYVVIFGILVIPIAATAELLACTGDAPTFLIQDHHQEAVKETKRQFLVDEKDTLAILIGVEAAKPYLVIKPWGVPAAQRFERNIPKGISVEFKTLDNRIFDVRLSLTKSKSELTLTCRVRP